MEKHHLDGQPEEARFYIPEGADNKGVPFGPEGEMPLTAAQEKIEQRRKKRQRREEGRRRRRKRLQVIGAVAGVFLADYFSGIEIINLTCNRNPGLFGIKLSDLLDPDLAGQTVFYEGG